MGLGFGSQPGPIFWLPMVHLEMAGDILFITTAVGGGRYWHLVDGDLECCPTPYSPQASPLTKKWTEILVALRRVLLRLCIHHVHYFKVSVKSVPISGYYEITNFLCTVSPN